MKASDHGYFAALTYDLRVRERLINAGVVTPAEIERYMNELPELETQAEGLGIPQPALVASSSPAPVASAPVAAADGSGSSSEAGGT